MRVKRGERIGKKKVKIYSTPTCPYCRMAKEFLRSKGIEFEDVDVSENQEAAKEMMEKSGSNGVPQIEINGKIIVGFDKEAIEKELGS
ncbi:MAG: NrdH-redoxin [Candidatus Aenigmarchaeota archaeon]|nr:NrdH-redoxin [Candidatus Aenigmarchaeota archaeon]